MKNNYRNALDKIKLDDSVKERAKNLFYETAPKHEKGRPIDMKIKKIPQTMSGNCGRRGNCNNS